MQTGARTGRKSEKSNIPLTVLKDYYYCVISLNVYVLCMALCVVRELDLFFKVASALGGQSFTGREDERME